MGRMCGVLKRQIKYDLSGKNDFIENSGQTVRFPSMFKNPQAFFGLKLLMYNYT